MFRLLEIIRNTFINPPTLEKRRRRREFILIFMLAILLIPLTYYEANMSSLPEQMNLPNNILIFALINLNIILLLLLLFLVMRNFTKLLLERRRRVFWSRLRTKLVLSFVAFSLVPTLLLFFTAAGFISRSIESWFAGEVEDSLRQSLEVANTYYENAAADALFFGGRLAERITSFDMLSPNNRTYLRNEMLRKQTDYKLGVVEIFSASGEELVRVSDPNVPTKQFSDPAGDLVQSGLAGESKSVIEPLGEADIVRGIVPIRTSPTDDTIAGVVVVNYFIPHSLVSKMTDIRKTFEDYRRQKLLKNPIRANYIGVLIMVALLIIFMATWSGFYLAKGITGPIQELAEGTGEIAAGNLDIEIPPAADKEIGMLVNSFNRMTRDLRTSRTQLSNTLEDLRQTVAESERQRRYIETVLANTSAGVIALDAEGKLNTLNPASEQMLELSLTEAIGKSYTEWLRPEQQEAVTGLLAEMAEAGGETIQRQIVIPRAEGASATYLVSLTALGGDGSAREGFVIVLEDLTQLIKAQRVAAWREVARRIAHEIKNPLTPIKVSAQRLRKRYLRQIDENDDVFDECTDTIIKSTDDLKNLVNEFSNFARMPEIEAVPYDFNSVISESLVLYTESHPEISFSFVQDETLPVLMIDPEQMKRAIINLLDNAIAACSETGGKGEIKLITEQIKPLGVARLSIADNGSGIDPADHNRLFEPYFSTKRQGTGLGLAIVSQIVSDHQGYIRVRKNQPQGSIFVIELPLISEGKQKIRSDKPLKIVS
jgi:two-component system, NtrC family, nitrogen regulation sensor histidine kinase NtrY